MRNFLPALVALLGPIGAVANPQPIIDFQLEHYWVSGQSTDDLRQQIFEKTPVWISGQKYGAATINNFQTAYALTSTAAGGCEVKNPSVRLSSKVILPKLIPGQYSDTLYMEWVRYIRALTEHEMQHAQNGKRAAEDLARQLASYSMEIPCARMNPILAEAVAKFIEQRGVWDVEFDQATRHGAVHGAELKSGIR